MALRQRRVGAGVYATLLLLMHRLKPPPPRPLEGPNLLWIVAFVFTAAAVLSLRLIRATVVGVHVKKAWNEKT